ncbi:tetratricopeptide repeat protein [Dankookia sp. P2]|uniref:tetratricopeptide repeat protein n=1 Tax=Dankookia sp. P2 TaxID=3423955 RepID=UPI003D67E9EC
MQDKVTEAVAGAVEPGVRLTETEFSLRKRPENLTAYDQYLRGLSRYYVVTREASDDAVHHLRQAIAADAGYAAAKATLAHCLMLRGTHRWTTPEDLAEAVRLAREALTTAKDDPEVLRLAGHVIATLGMDVATGLAATRRAVSMNPNSAAANASAGWVHNQAGEGHQAVVYFERARRLSPRDPNLGRYLSGLSLAAFLSADLVRAELAARDAISEAPQWPLGHLALALALAKQNRIQEAQAASQQLLAVVPEFRITQNAFFQGLMVRLPVQAAIMQEAAVAAEIPL